MEKNSLTHTQIFLIDQVQADLNRNSLSGPNGEIRLEPRVMEILGQLANADGQVVLRNQMLDEYGSDEGITRAISLLRKALKKVGSGSKYIETIPKRGYRLVVPAVAKSDDIDQSIVVSETPHVASLAVLPFLDLSENQDQGYLSDGISEEIINAMVRLPFLRVSGRTSSFSFRGTRTNVREIATELNVSHVLEGSVRTQGQKMRITAQLIEAVNDKHLWSENFDGSLDDIFDLQENIARAIEQKLRKLFSVESSSNTNLDTLTEKLTQNKEAYNHFLLGRHLMYGLSGQRTIPRAVAAFEKAVDVDPSFANAWAHLAIANFKLSEYSTTQDWASHISTARRQAEHALALEPNNAWAQRARAGFLSYDLKLDEAVDAYKQALDFDPNDPELMFTYGYILAAIGLNQQAGDLMKDALDREPLLGPWNAALGTVQFAKGQLDQAETLFKKSFDYSFGYGAILFAQLLVHRGRTDEALQFIKHNFDGLGDVTRSQLKSPIMRKLAYAAFFNKSKLARFIVDRVFTKRMNNSEIQPALGTILGFILIGRPGKFIQHVLDKPNPYVGYALSRIWEPTEEARSVRMHQNFPDFAESIGLVKAWQKHGWPETIQPNEGTDGSNGQFTCS